MKGYKVIEHKAAASRDAFWWRWYSARGVSYTQRQTYNGRA